ncbi:MAG: capsid assembly protein [Geminicoccaceae bacterium]
MSDQAFQAEALEIPPATLTSVGEGSLVAPSNEPGEEAILDAADVESIADELSGSQNAHRPADVPEKFWDVDAGALRTETLLKSYLELEKKLGSMVPIPNDDDPSSRDRLQRVLGKPASSDDYDINPPHELITPDPAINAKLHEAGLSSEQAQLVYDLAAEHLVPMIEDANREASQEIDRSRLAAQFGGEEKWQAVAPQIKTWAEANLSDEVYESLGASVDGVVAIYHMMQAREPNMISEAAVPSGQVDERQLSQMMRDPKYWRDRDPAFVAEVTSGYKRLFE